MVCPHVQEIIHSLKLVDYLHVQADGITITYLSLDFSSLVTCSLHRRFSIESTVITVCLEYVQGSVSSV